MFHDGRPMRLDYVTLVFLVFLFADLLIGVCGIGSFGIWGVVIYWWYILNMSILGSFLGNGTELLWNFGICLVGMWICHLVFGFGICGFGICFCRFGIYGVGLV